MSLNQARVGPVNSLRDAQGALNSIQDFADSVANVLSNVFEAPPAGEFRIVVVQDDGKAYLYEFLAGAGVTLTFDDSAKTLTATSP